MSYRETILFSELLAEHFAQLVHAFANQMVSESEEAKHLPLPSAVKACMSSLTPGFPVGSQFGSFSDGDVCLPRIKSLQYIARDCNLLSAVAIANKKAQATQGK